MKLNRSRFLLLLSILGFGLMPSCSLVTAERTKDYFASYSRYSTDPNPKFYAYKGKTYVLIHRKDYSRRSSDWVTWIMTKEKFSYIEQELPKGTSNTYLYELPKAHEVSLLARIYDEPIKYPMEKDDLYTHIFSKTKEASFVSVSKIPLGKATPVKSEKILIKEDKPTCGYPTMSEYSHRSIVGKLMWPVEKVQLAAVDTPGSIILTTLAMPAAPFAMTAQQVVSSKDELMHEVEEVKGQKNEMLCKTDEAKSKAKKVKSSASDLKENSEASVSAKVSPSQQQPTQAPDFPEDGENIRVEETGK